jgi:branched-chain amino acid transport system ATP-binding protein
MLDIDSLDAYYDKSHVVTDLSLSIDDGEAMAILGRNGAGKTTTIHSIMGTGGVRTTGDITFDGSPLAGLTPESRAGLGIGWIPEGRRIFPNLTVKENLRMGAIRARDDSVTFEEIYDIFPRLSDRTDQLGGTMSGGEQQMLAIARTLLTDPDLLLIDEPFEGLMPSLVDQLVDVLSELVDRGFSILLVEQKPEETLSIADKACILDAGKIVYKGTPDELQDQDALLERHIGIA